MGPTLFDAVLPTESYPCGIQVYVYLYGSTTKLVGCGIKPPIPLNVSGRAGTTLCCRWLSCNEFNGGWGISCAMHTSCKRTEDIFG